MLKILKHPLTLFMLTSILMFLLLFFYRSPQDYTILIAGAIVLSLSVITYGFILYYGWGDEYLFIIASMLVIIGVVMLYRLDDAIGFKHIVRYAIGIVIFSVSYVFYRYFNFWQKLKWYYLATGMGLFIFTLLFGKSIGGAKNWISFGGFLFQPSEFIKLLFIFYLACHYFYKSKKELKIWIFNEQYISMGIVYLFLGMLILQREWGSTMLFFFTYLILLYIFQFDWKMISLNTALMSIVSVLGYYCLPHIQIRVSNWVNPWSDIANKGYQITQSLFAIAAGGFFGTGIGLGKPNFIPEVQSDFIFSAVCEEMGIFGGIAVILLFFILVYRGFKISLRLQGFDKCVAVGITVMFAMQTFIIVGGVIKLIPLTGITLPFISYGGSSLLSSFIALGILQALSSKGDKKHES